MARLGLPEYEGVTTKKFRTNQGNTNNFFVRNEAPTVEVPEDANVC